MANNFGSTIINKTLNFYSKNEDHFKQWYLDFPEYIKIGGKQEQLQMTMGVDILLDRLSNNASKLSLKVSDYPFKGCNYLHLESECNITEEFKKLKGAFYYIHVVNSKIYDDHLWFSDVIAILFEGVFPPNIYYAVVDN